MSGVFNLAPVVTHLQVGMMIFSMGYPGHHINEGQGLVIVLEFESFTDQLVILNPVIELLSSVIISSCDSGSVPTSQGLHCLWVRSKTLSMMSSLELVKVGTRYMLVAFSLFVFANKNVYS